MIQGEIFLDSLYTIKGITSDDSRNKLMISIQLNPSHEIFKGHFPVNPILPGVCIVQILKEILMCHLDNRLSLCYSSSIKYLSFIDPRVISTINIDMDLNQVATDKICCNASFGFELVVFCRFKGEFIIKQKSNQ
jgi:3-hydroxyacyl-[acyl-carrier-protein] dehydratase